MVSRRVGLLVVAAILLSCGCGHSAVPAAPPPPTAAMTQGQPAKNIIFMIGDGMGKAHADAAAMYLGKPLCWTSFPHKGEITTYSANSAVTDSAAAGTAMATGVKVNNEVVSVAIPGDGHKLPTSLEYWSAKGKLTGLVTTSYMTDATPAVFGAHQSARGKKSDIAADYLKTSRPNVLFGGGGNGMRQAEAEAAGYAVVTDRASMQALDPAKVAHAAGIFGRTSIPYEADGVGELPHLTEMTVKALAILERGEKGFFVMIEGGRIDHAAHNHDTRRNVFETVEFDRAVRAVLAWAQTHPDTIILVTADHETGGLTVHQDNGAGNLPNVAWTAASHTGVNVPLYAWGVGAERVTGVMNNTDLFRLTTWTTPAEKPAPVPATPEKAPASEPVGAGTEK